MCMLYYKDPFVLKAFKKDGSVHLFEEVRIKGLFHKHPALHWGNSFEYLITSDISGRSIPMSEFL